MLKRPQEDYTNEDGTTGKKLQDAEDVEYQPLNTSDSIFFFQGMNQIYDMSDMVKHKPGSSQETGKQLYGIILNFEGASNFGIDQDAEYYFVLELKRSATNEYTDGVSTIQEIRIPLTTVGTGAEYGYRMNVTNSNQLSVNLNKDTVTDINIQNEFSGVTLEDNSRVQLRYELQYKGADNKYQTWKIEDTDVDRYTGDIKVRGVSLKNGGKPTFDPWYLTMNWTNNEEDTYTEKVGTREYDVTKNSDGSITIRTKTSESQVITSATLTGNRLSVVQADVLGDAGSSTIYTSGQTANTDVEKQMVNYLNYIQANGVTTGYTGTLGEKEKVVRTQMSGILQIMKKDSLNPSVSNGKELEDANGKPVYQYQTDVTFDVGNSTEGKKDLPLGNYKLIGKLVIDGTEVASDYIIFNVNKLNINDVIQDSNLWYRNDNSNTDSGSN